MRRAAAVLMLVFAAPVPALAQAESREGIFLQNQILQLRQELDQLRRGGSSLGTTSSSRGPQGPQGEMVGALLDRVARLEEENRTLRGRLDESEFRGRTLTQTVEKLQGDIDFRLQQLEGPGGRPAAPAATPPARPGQPGAAARTPERALSEGQAALARRDFPAAEAAAREVIGVRGSPRAYDARFLLADSEAGQRNWQDAAVAYGEAYRANQRGSRAAEALVGFGTSLANLNQRREACEALALAQSEFPNLRGPLREKLDAGKQRAGCR